MNYTKGEIKTLGDAWKVLKEHGLEGSYCPHCNQFSQARVLQKQDELMSGMEAVLRQFVRYCKQWQESNREFPNGDGRALILKNATQALAKAEGK